MNRLLKNNFVNFMNKVRTCLICRIKLISWMICNSKSRGSGVKILECFNRALSRNRLGDFYVIGINCG